MPRVPYPHRLCGCCTGSQQPDGVCCCTCCPTCFPMCPIPPPPTQAVRQLHRDQLTAFRARVAERCKEWAAKIAELKEINDAAGGLASEKSTTGRVG